MISLTCFLLAAGAASASGTLSGGPEGCGSDLRFPGTDDIVDSYAYDPDEVMSTIGASFGDFACVDDFDYGSFGVFFGYYYCWAVTTGTPPVELELLVVEDGYGSPSGPPVSQESYPVYCINSGFTFAGYTVWRAEINTGGITVDTPVWLGSHRADGTDWYPAGGTTITGSEGHRTTAAGWIWQSFTASGIPAGDLFKIISEWPVSSALERNTWAGIKRALEGGAQ